MPAVSGRWREVECSVQRVAVVMVSTKMRSARSRWRGLTIRSQSRHSARTVRMKRSATAFACGARTGVRMISIASLRKMVSNSRVNLLLRVARARTLDPAYGWVRYRLPWDRQGIDHATVAGDLLAPASVSVGQAQTSEHYGAKRSSPLPWTIVRVSLE